MIHGYWSIGIRITSESLYVRHTTLGTSLIICNKISFESLELIKAYGSIYYEEHHVSHPFLVFRSLSCPNSKYISLSLNLPLLRMQSFMQARSKSHYSTNIFSGLFALLELSRRPFSPRSTLSLNNLQLVGNMNVHYHWWLCENIH